MDVLRIGYRDMANARVALQIDVLQRAAKIRAALHRLADPVRNIEILQSLDISGSRGRGDWIDGDDKPDPYACLTQLFRHVDGCSSPQ